MRIFFYSIAICLAIALTLGTACGEEPVDGGDGEESQQDEHDDDDDDDDNDKDDEDCDDDQQYNPTTGQCVEIPVDDDDDDNSDSGDNGDDDDANDDTPCGPGAIEGETCRPDGEVLPGAQLTVSGLDCDGASFTETTTADGQGYYEFSNVPAGQHELTVASGSFEISDSVVVDAGQTTEMFSDAQKLCMTGTEADIAIMEGNFDDVAGMLDDMGIDYDLYPAGFGVSNEVYEFVTDLDAMLEYDIIFAECQVDLPRSPSYDQDLVEQNVRRFVEEGNSFYASDRADEWFYESIPEAIDFDLSVGGLGGPSSDPVEAQVVDEEMQELLGQDTMEIQFDTSGWTVTTGGGSGTTIYLSADDFPLASPHGQTYDSAPLVVSYPDPIGGGNVTYTSFHNSAQLTDQMEVILQHLFFQL